MRRGELWRLWLEVFTGYFFVKDLGAAFSQALVSVFKKTREFCLGRLRPTFPHASPEIAMTMLNKIIPGWFVTISTPFFIQAKGGKYFFPYTISRLTKMIIFHHFGQL